MSYSFGRSTTRKNAFAGGSLCVNLMAEGKIGERNMALAADITALALQYGRDLAPSFIQF